jgi:hypothetical protein
MIDHKTDLMYAFLSVESKCSAMSDRPGKDTSVPGGGARSDGERHLSATESFQF